MSAERDIRSDAAADRLLEQTWRQRRRRLPRHELLSEFVASALFAAAACALLWLGGAPGGFDPAVAAGLLAIYVILAAIEFPVGAGNVLPTHLALMPMLVLLPPAAVPPLVAARCSPPGCSTGCGAADRSTGCCSPCPTPASARQVCATFSTKSRATIRIPPHQAMIYPPGCGKACCCSTPS